MHPVRYLNPSFRIFSAACNIINPKKKASVRQNFLQRSPSPAILGWKERADFLSDLPNLLGASPKRRPTYARAFSGKSMAEFVTH